MADRRPGPDRRLGVGCAVAFVILAPTWIVIYYLFLEWLFL